MTTKPIVLTTRDAAAKGSFYLFDPDQLTLITDEKHPLFDPRALTKPDEGLVQSMLTFGFKTSASIEVESTKTGMLVVDGRRRVLAARECKRRQIEAGEDVTIRVRCIVVKGDSFQGMILGNAHRLDDTLFQKAAKAKRAIDMGQTEQEAATLFGVTTQTIRNWLSILNLPTDLKNLLQGGQITMTLALEAGRLPPEEQAAVLAKAQEAPIRGEAGKERVRKQRGDDEGAKKLTSSQMRKFLEALREDKTPSANTELAMAILKFVLGEDKTGRALNQYSGPLAEIAKSIRK